MSLIRFLGRLGTLVLCLAVVFSSSGSTPSSSAGSATAVSTSKAFYLTEAALGVEKLQSWYDWRTGLWRTTNWWNAANATTVLVNYSSLSGSTQYQPAVENTYSVNASRGFLNNYYDDEGWWALGWIDAYDWTQNTDYLNMASSIFQDMTGGWDDVCGGPEGGTMFVEAEFGGAEPGPTRMQSPMSCFCPSRLTWPIGSPIRTSWHTTSPGPSRNGSGFPSRG